MTSEEDSDNTSSDVDEHESDVRSKAPAAVTHALSSAPPTTRAIIAKKIRRPRPRRRDHYVIRRARGK